MKRKLKIAAAALALLGAAGTALGATYGDASPQLTLPSAPLGFSIDAGVSTTSAPVTVTVKNESAVTALSSAPMLPSTWVGAYTLSVLGKDAANNTSTTDVPIWYDPPKAGLTSATSGRVSIPAITTPVKDQFGNDALISETLKRTDGSTVTGSRQVFAAIKPAGTIALRVNGVAVRPGAAPVSVGVVNFAQPILSVPLAVDEAGVSGESPLILLIADSKAPVIETTVATWGADVALTTDKWTVYQAVTPVKIQVAASGNMPCQVVASTTPNRRTDVCRLHWTSLPEGLEPATGSLNLSGRLWADGPQKIAYTLYYFDGRNEVPVATGERTITATAPLGMFSFNPSRPVAPVTRGIGAVDVTMAQAGGPSCTLTSTLDAAKAASGPNQLGCYLQWTALPTGVAADPKSTTPRLTGLLRDAGQQSASWQAYVVAPSGNQTLVAQGDVVFDTVDPTTPALSFVASAPDNGGMLAVPVTGGTIGDVSITSDRAMLTFELRRDGKVIATDTINATQTQSVSFSTRRPVKVDAAEIWRESRITMRVAYRDLPDVYAEAAAQVVYVASTTVKPLIAAATTSELDTNILPVTVSIRDTATPNAPYSADSMGQWRVRVVLSQTGGQSTPLTAYVDVLNGEAAFDVPLTSFGGSSIRLDAEAQLITSNPAAARVEKSPRAVSVSVLRGGAIGAAVGAERIVGPAPLSSAFVLQLANTGDQAAIGTVDWEASDDGSIWKTLPAGSAKYKPRLTYRFDAGRHLVRAKLINRYSNEVSYTDPVEVLAFDVPVVTLSGPSQVFVGGRASYVATVTAKDGTIPAYDLQWTQDGGSTWTAGTDRLEITRAEESKLPLRVRARLRSAPTDQDTAWTEARMQVDFLRVRPPNVRISGPSLAETGRQATFRASVTLPLPNMVGTTQGEWTLPDGTVVSGNEVEWTPVQADEAKGSVNFTYRAWIDGFREAGAEATAVQTVKVWTYRWPEWSVSVNSTYESAPSDAVLRVSALGNDQRIENLAIVWTIPPELTVLDARRDQGRRVNVDRAGTYPVQIDISDARGNRTVLDTNVTLGEPPPLAMTLELRPGNKYSRAPLDMTVLPKITGGHPRNTPTAYTYTVDGVQQPGAGNSVGRVTLNDGSHTVGVGVDMRMGDRVTAEQAVTVNPNRPPTCKVDVRAWNSGWNYQAVCTDPDGRITKYRWKVDGVEQSLSSDRITISKRDRPSAPLVSVIGVDDSGAESPEAVAR
ncbi:hypothetical protein [Azospirillum sp. sgz302134]